MLATIVVQTNIKGWALQPGDVVTIVEDDSELGYARITINGSKTHWLPQEVLKR